MEVRKWLSCIIKPTTRVKYKKKTAKARLEKNRFIRAFKLALNVFWVNSQVLKGRASSTYKYLIKMFQKCLILFVLILILYWRVAFQLIKFVEKLINFSQTFYLERKESFPFNLIFLFSWLFWKVISF